MGTEVVLSLRLSSGPKGSAIHHLLANNLLQFIFQCVRWSHLLLVNMVGVAHSPTSPGALPIRMTESGNVAREILRWLPHSAEGPFTAFRCQRVFGTSLSGHYAFAFRLHRCLLHKPSVFLLVSNWTALLDWHVPRLAAYLMLHFGPRFDRLSTEKWKSSFHV